ncbi:MAG: NAD(P)-dependent oxidoreductase [Actinomycetota bacterium]|nr:NAD(P)-dependent oxidoreductase [Actinomycetota bacterium]
MRDGEQELGQTPKSNEPASTVVVTGAAGWLGQNLVRTLAGQPSRHRIRCLVRDPGDASRLEVVDPRIEVIVGDVRDPAVIDALFEGVGGASVMHAAAVIHPASRVRELFDVNVGGTQLVLDRARRVGASRFVHVSSNSPFGANRSSADRFDEDSAFAPYMAYGRAKLEAEQLVQRSYDRGDLATVIVRPPWFYGPFQPDRQTQFLSAVRRGRFPLVGPGTQRRSMVYTGNLVQGVLLAERVDAAPGNAYWIADAEPYALREVLQTVRGALEAEGLSVSNRRPLPVPRIAGVIAEKLDAVTQASGRYVQVLHVLGELKDTIACDISRARKELGYKPTVDLFDGMRASVRWCMARGDRL